MIVEPVFEPFGTPHLVTLALIAAVSVGLPLWARFQDVARARTIAAWIALALVVYRTAYIPVVAWLYDEPVRLQLPLHICGILFYICAYALWKRDQRAYEVAYLWGMGGTSQALLTPEMTNAFPHPTYLSHFAGHGALIVAICYLTVALRMRPVPASILRVLGVTLMYAAILLPINLLLGTNYMYLLGKPASFSMLDYLGPWPWYIVAAIGVALVSYLIWYLPFWILDRRRRAAPGAA